MEHTVKLNFVESTKGTHKYSQPGEKATAVFPMLYLPKGKFPRPDSPPPQIEVVVIIPE